jgi:hypothetical protein
MDASPFERRLAALTQLHLAGQELAKTRDGIEGAVRAAREAGISWQLIGEALDMTRQGAWEQFHRFGPHIP